MDNLHILENEHLRVTVADAGAELTGVYDKDRRMERLWSGDPAVWNRHAPILFPFVGKVVDGKYRFDGREYAMKTQHGFARDRVFAPVGETGVSCEHVLVADDETRRIYPFDFRLTVRHRLEGRTLRVGWTVENPGGGRMVFSIGGHPGFLLPEGCRKEDAFILLPGLDRAVCLSANSAGYILPEIKTLTPENGRVRYRQDIPDTWIFEDSQVKRVGIADAAGNPWVMMDCAQFPMLAVWANPKGPFICLEPWVGRADDDGFTGDIEQKKDVLTLQPGEKKDISYSVEFL